MSLWVVVSSAHLIEVTMTIPSIIFGVAIAALLGGGFHFWRGGSNARLAIYLAVAQVGFWGGHFTAEYFQWNFAPVGPLQAGMGTIGAALLLILTEVLGRIELPPAEEES
jgi:hypothetical protein